MTVTCGNCGETRKATSPLRDVASHEACPTCGETCASEVRDDS